MKITRNDANWWKSYFINPSLKFLTMLLGLSLVMEIISLLAIILAVIYDIYKNHNMGNNLMIVLFIITFICIIIITFELMEIMKAFIDREVFILKNVLRLRKVGFSTIIVGVFIFINNIS